MVYVSHSLIMGSLQRNMQLYTNAEEKEKTRVRIQDTGNKIKTHTL